MANPTAKVIPLPRQAPARLTAAERVLAKIREDGLTDALVKRLPVPEKGSRITYDSQVPGFGVRVTAAGARSFVLNYHTRSGRERRYTIGSNWRVAAARKKARDLKHLIEDGGDPLADIEDERAAPTVSDLIARFEAEHLPRKRAGTAADYQRMIKNHIRPHFGRHTKVADVQFEDINRLHHRITAAGYKHRANRVIAVCSKMFSLSVRWKMRIDNPCKGIERNDETKRKRYLKGDELARLTAALSAHTDQQIANVFRVLLLTGARRGEVLGMRWADVDLTDGKWTKPGSTTKQKTEHEVPLSEPARQLLSEIRDAQAGKRKVPGEFVFPGAGDSRHIVNIKRAWRSLCKAAGVTGLRVHDLRHSYASFLASGGASLPLIGALLGHSNPVTTQRYAHLFDDVQRTATERVGAIIGAAGQPAKTARKRRGG